MPVAKQAHDRQTMADKHHGKAQSRAQLFQRQQDMCLGRNVEPRDDFIDEDELRMEPRAPPPESRARGTPRLPYSARP